MNRISTLALLFIFLPVLSMAQGNDHREILQICIDEPEVQNILASTGNRIVIMQHGISFPVETEMDRYRCMES